MINNLLIFPGWEIPGISYLVADISTYRAFYCFLKTALKQNQIFLFTKLFFFLLIANRTVLLAIFWRRFFSTVMFFFVTCFFSVHNALGDKKVHKWPFMPTILSSLKWFKLKQLIKGRTPHISCDRLTNQRVWDSRISGCTAQFLDGFKKWSMTFSYECWSLKVYQLKRNGMWTLIRLQVFKFTEKERFNYCVKHQLQGQSFSLQVVN